MKEHQHKFVNIGGGCGLPINKDYDPNYCCDDDYKCDCGLVFRVYTTSIGHKYLPRQFDFEGLNEIQEAEQEALSDAFLQNIKISPNDSIY